MPGSRRHQLTLSGSTPFHSLRSGAAGRALSGGAFGTDSDLGATGVDLNRRMRVGEVPGHDLGNVAHRGGCLLEGFGEVHRSTGEPVHRLGEAPEQVTGPGQPRG